MMRCGNCRDRHATVDDVKDCYAQTQHEGEEAKAEQAAEARAEKFYEEGTEAQHAQYRHEVEEDDRRNPLDPQTGNVDLLVALQDSVRTVRELELEEEELAAARLDAMTGAPGRDMASDKQVKYVMDLLSQKVWPDKFSETDVRNMERRQVSKLINNLKSSPNKNAPSVQDWARFKSIPSGRYCLEADGGTLHFYQVDVPDSGRYKGRIFLQELYGSPRDYRRETRHGDAAVAVYEAILKDPKQASLLYGIKSEVCGVCHSPLTNTASLARGIGPICAGKRGW